MKKRHGTNVLSKAVDQLLAASGHRLDPEMSKALMGRVYVLEDGRALFVDHDGSGILWDSHSELLTRYRASVKAALEHRGHRPTAVISDPERFCVDAVALGAELPRFLELNPRQLDFSEQSLDVVDQFIREHGTERMLSSEVFPSVVAYVGEVIRRAVGGTWGLASADHVPGDPVIVDVTGQSYPVLRVYKELLEHRSTASVRGFAHALLRMHRLMPRH